MNLNLTEITMQLVIDLLNIVAQFFQLFARLFGFPNNPGMPVDSSGIIPQDNSPLQFEKELLALELPRRPTVIDVVNTPNTIWEIFFGEFPRTQPISKYFFESVDEGYYNFYILNYKNLVFLPSELSENFQIWFNISTDHSTLEQIKEALFIMLMVFSGILAIRVFLSWFLIINPYTFPWYILVSFVDWIEEFSEGLIPNIIGVNVGSAIIIGVSGICADLLNNLIFTMPYLPSEGEPAEMIVNNELKHVIVFHNLPYLWYKYPIPENLREYWFFERQDILNYMIKSYSDLNIQFLPSIVLKNSNFFDNFFNYIDNIPN